MIKGKRKLTYSFLFSLIALHFIMVIQFVACSNFHIIWKFKAGDRLRDVAISDDGSTIVVVGYDQNVHLFSSNNNIPLWSYPASDSLFYTTLSSDGSYIVTGSSGGYVRFFEKSSSEPLWSYKTGASVGSLAICPDGSYIAAGSNYYVHLFDKQGPSPFWSYQTINAHIESLAISSNGELIAAASSTYDRGNTYLFNKSTNTPLWFFRSSFTHSVAMSSDGDYIVSGCGLSYIAETGNITLFHRSSNDTLWCYDTTPHLVYRVAISTNGHYIAATTAFGDDNKLYFFERSTPNPIWTYNLPGDSSDLAMSNDGRYIVVGIESNLICSFDTSKKILLWAFNTQGTVESVDISSEGDYIVGADDWGNVWLIRNINPSNLIPSFPIFIIGIITTSTLIIVIWIILNKKNEILKK